MFQSAMVKFLISVSLWSFKTGPCYVYNEFCFTSHATISFTCTICSAFFLFLLIMGIQRQMHFMMPCSSLSRISNHLSHYVFPHIRHHKRYTPPLPPTPTPPCKSTSGISCLGYNPRLASVANSNHVSEQSDCTLHLSMF